jgi:hypothetical protein
MEGRLDTGIDDLWGALTDPDRLSQFRVRVEDRAPLQVNRVMAPGGVEPPHADSKFVENSCSQFYSVLLRALRFSQFCRNSAVRDTVWDTLFRLNGQRSLLDRVYEHPECPLSTK